MRKIVLTVILLACSLITIGAQDIERLDEQTIAECKTPEAVAYNFIMAVVTEDYDKMEKLVTPDFSQMVSEIMAEEGFETYSQFFNSEIVGGDIVWARDELLELGLDLVISKKYFHSSQAFHGVDQDKELLSINFHLALQDAIITTDDSGTFGRDGRVGRIILECVNGEWKVWSFK